MNPFNEVPKGNIFIKNVGANTSHPKENQSLLFGNNTFEFFPILERRGYPDVTTIGELKQFNNSGEVLTKLPRYSTLHTSDRVHNDPEFDNFTYGSGKPDVGLDSLYINDFLFFIARLVPENIVDAKFALIGFLEIDYVLSQIDDPMLNDPSFSNNEHIKRYHAYFTKGFTVYRGSKNSRRFEKAVIVDRKFVEEAYILDAYKNPWNWGKHKTDLAAIGSYTRRARLHIEPKFEPERAQRFWKKVSENQ